MESDGLCGVMLVLGIGLSVAVAVSVVSLFVLGAIWTFKFVFG